MLVIFLNKFHNKIDMIIDIISLVAFLVVIYQEGVLCKLIALTLAYIYYWMPKYLVYDLFFDIFYPKVLTHNKETTKKKIAMTFNDIFCPDGDFEQILSILSAYSFKATFFITSDYVSQDDQNLLVKAVKKGHQLGNRGKTDSSHIIKTRDELDIEINECDKLIKYIYMRAGIELPKLMVFRPAGGLFSNNMVEQVENNDYTLTFGSVCPSDSIITLPSLNHYYLMNHVEKGDIIVLHDNKSIYKTLGYFCQWLLENEYKSITVDRLCT